MGNASAFEAVDSEAKRLAAKQLVQLVTREVEKKAAAASVVQPKAAPAPLTETPEQLREGVRAALSRRRA
jgi:hypothetical protein